MAYTLGQAAKASGFGKSTLSRALKKGTLSAKRLDDGSYSIDPSELERWKDSNGHRNSQSVRVATHVEPVEQRQDTPEIKVLEKEVELLRQQLERSEADCTHWREQAGRITALIENRSAQRKGFWARVFG